MSLHTVRSFITLGIDAHPVTIEAYAAVGLPSFTIVGLPDGASRETRDRIRAAFMASGLDWPQRRVTVNVLSIPGHAHYWSSYDLPIALAVLGAIGHRVGPNIGAVGELGLDGAVRMVAGINLGDFEGYWLAPIGAIAWHSVSNLAEALLCANTGQEAEPQPSPEDRLELDAPNVVTVIGTAEQAQAEAAELAQHVSHNRQAIAHRVHYAAGIPMEHNAVRFPHANASMLAVIGGHGRRVAPGEMSLAAGGALILDALEAATPIIDAVARVALQGHAWTRIARGHITVDMPLPANVVLWVDPERITERRVRHLIRTPNVIDRRADIPENDPLARLTTEYA